MIRDRPVTARRFSARMTRVGEDFESALRSVAIAAPDDIRPAAVSLRDFAWRRGGFRVAACHNIASKRPMTDAEGELLATSVFGWTSSDPWWCSPLLALSSPLPAACRFESEPFWCNAAGFHGRLPNPQLDEIDRTDFAARAFTRAAILVPVHLPFGQIGAVSFTLRDKESDDLSEEFEAHATPLGLLARQFIAGYARLRAEPRRLPPTSPLTKREVECLKWTAAGKTDVEISMILALSRATVRFHLRNASRKLNAVNKSQVLFKAAQLGYVTI
jgi:LuxR family quorum-sensing system transcriptional regulator CciR